MDVSVISQQQEALCLAHRELSLLFTTSSRCFVNYRTVTTVVPVAANYGLCILKLPLKLYDIYTSNTIIIFVGIRPETRDVRDFYTASPALSACSQRCRPAIVLRITRDIRSVPDRVKRLLFSCPGLSGLMQVYTPPGRPAELAFRMHHIVKISMKRYRIPVIYNGI